MYVFTSLSISLKGYPGYYGLLDPQYYFLEEKISVVRLPDSQILYDRFIAACKDKEFINEVHTTEIHSTLGQRSCKNIGSTYDLAFWHLRTRNDVFEIMLPLFTKPYHAVAHFPIPLCIKELIWTQCLHKVYYYTDVIVKATFKDFIDLKSFIAKDSLCAMHGIPGVEED